jgi:hypothetical protein
MAKSTVLRGIVYIKEATLSSGAGDYLLTLDSNTGEVGYISGTPITTTLTSGYLFVGNASNVATATAVTGDVLISNAGVTSIATGVIVNADINASAAIAVSKLEALTASRALVTDGSGFASVSAVTATELGYVSGASSNLQTQINAKQATITGAASTVVSSNLTANRAVVSGSGGKLEVSATTLTELGYVSGVTSALQTQLDTKLSVSLASEANGDILVRSGGVWVNVAAGSNGEVLTISGGAPSWQSGVANGVPSGGTTAQYLVKSSGTDYDVAWDTLDVSQITDITASAADLNLMLGLDGTITTVELGYLAGVTSLIQDQLDAKLPLALAYNAIWVGDGSNSAVQFPTGADGTVLTSVGGVPQWQTPSPPGDVTGPGSSTDNAIARFNGIAGDAIQNSGIIIDDTDNITGVASLRTLNQGGLILRELTANGTNAVTVRAHGTMAGDYTITLPAAAPSANTYLKYDGADYVWAVASGGGGTALQQKEVSTTTYSASDADDGYVIYFTNVAGCTVTLPNTISTDISFTTVRADGAGLISHVDDGTSVLFTIGGEVDIEDEYGAATWVKKSATVFYGWGSLGPAASGGGGTVNSVTGTTNRITIGGTASDPTVDISTSYVGQATITTLGTIATGVWQGTAVGYAYGGTGLTALGTAGQLIKVNAGATALEYFTPAYISANQTITLTGDVTGSHATGIATTIAANAVTDGKFRQSAGLSVVGRTTNSTGNVADITAGTDLDVLWRNGTSLAFAPLPFANLSSKPTTMSGYGITDGVSVDARSTVTISGSTLTLDVNSKKFAYYVLNTARSTDFTIAMSNTTSMEQLECLLIITGTVNVTLPSACQMQKSESDAGRWDETTNILTLTGATGSYFKLVISKVGSDFLVDASSYYL